MHAPKVSIEPSNDTTNTSTYSITPGTITGNQNNISSTSIINNVQSQSQSQLNNTSTSGTVLSHISDNPTLSSIYYNDEGGSGQKGGADIVLKDKGGLINQGQGQNVIETKGNVNLSNSNSRDVNVSSNINGNNNNNNINGIDKNNSSNRENDVNSNEHNSAVRKISRQSHETKISVERDINDTDEIMKNTSDNRTLM